MKCISGVGPALVDRICKINEYPKRGGQAIVTESTKQAGGAAANTIFGLAFFGNFCRFYTTLGFDADADFFKSSLEKVGVEVRAWKTHPETGRVDIYVDSMGERTFFVHPNASAIVSLKLEKEDYISSNLFYLDPFPSKDSFNVHKNIAKKAKEFGVCVILNPGYPYSSLGFKKLSELLEYVDILILSEFEFNMLGGNVEDFMEFLEILVVTRGSAGSVAYLRGDLKSKGVCVILNPGLSLNLDESKKEFFEVNILKVEVPAFRTEVVDTTGAGDSFAAGFINAMLKGYNIEMSLKAGNYVASYNIQHFGARNFPTWRDVEKALSF